MSNNSTGDGLRRDPVLRIEAVGTACVVSLGGELDLYNAESVRAAPATSLRTMSMPSNMPRTRFATTPGLSR